MSMSQNHSNTDSQFLIVKYTLGACFALVIIIFAWKIVGLFYVYITGGKMAKDIGVYLYKIIEEVPGLGGLIKWFAEHRNVS